MTMNNRYELARAYKAVEDTGLFYSYQDNLDVEKAIGAAIDELNKLRVALWTAEMRNRIETAKQKINGSEIFLLQLEHRGVNAAFLRIDDETDEDDE